MIQLSQALEDNRMAKMEGYDDAIVGLGQIGGGPMVFVYDADAVIKLLEQDMDEQAAAEFFEFNIRQMYVGPETWIILEKIQDE